MTARFRQPTQTWRERWAGLTGREPVSASEHMDRYLEAWAPDREKAGPWRMNPKAANSATERWLRRNLKVHDWVVAHVGPLGWTTFDHGEHNAHKPLERRVLAKGTETGQAGRDAADASLLAHWSRDGR